MKGLASGFENVATLDLMLTLRPALRALGPVQAPPAKVVESLVDGLLADDAAMSPSRLYVALLRHGITSRWDLSRLDLRSVTAQLREADFAIDPRSARVVSNHQP